MAKGSVRKKGKKWYYRFYVEDASGNLVQKEYAGTEGKNETEKLLRQAMEDYESKKFIAKADNITLGQLEVAGLTWQDINFEEQCLAVRRSVRYNGAPHKHEIGSTKRKKVRIVDFGNALANILKKARKQQLKNRMQYGELYHRNFYREVTEKNRVHYEYYNLGMTENVPEDYTEISFVCLREDGCLELPATVETACRTAARKVPELEGFHFHTLRHPYVKLTTKNIYLYTRFRFENASRSLHFLDC